MGAVYSMDSGSSLGAMGHLSSFRWPPFAHLIVGTASQFAKCNDLGFVWKTPNLLCKFPFLFYC